MLYRPARKDFFKVDRINFTNMRWIRLPHQIYLGWIGTKGGLREPTPLPVSLTGQLKEGYHWPELIH